MSDRRPKVGTCAVCGGKCQPHKDTCAKCPDQPNRTTVLEHRTDCAEPDVHEQVGRHGDHMQLCLGCRRFAVIDPDDERAQVSLPGPKPIQTGYVCRPHYAPVTSKGRGCPRCAADIAQSRAARQRQRKTSREQTTTERTQPE